MSFPASRKLSYGINGADIQVVEEEEEEDDEFELGDDDDEEDYDDEEYDEEDDEGDEDPHAEGRAMLGQLLNVSCLLLPSLRPLRSLA